MHKSKRTLTLAFEDRASAYFRSLVDLVPKGRGFDVPPLPVDLIHTSASQQPDGSVVITSLPSPAVLKWASRVAADCWPHSIRSLKIELPE